MADWRATSWSTVRRSASTLIADGIVEKRGWSTAAPSAVRFRFRYTFTPIHPLPRPIHPSAQGYRRSAGFTWLSGYVLQHDSMYATLTVKETLSFAANMLLQLPAGQRAARVARVMDELRLADIADNLIGSEMKRGAAWVSFWLQAIPQRRVWGLPQFFPSPFSLPVCIAQSLTHGAPLCFARRVRRRIKARERWHSADLQPASAVSGRAHHGPRCLQLAA